VSFRGAATRNGGSQAPPIRAHARVVANTVEGSGWKLLLEVPGWPGARPGQFVMLGPGAESAVVRRDPLLPRPMAVYRDLSGRDAVGPGEAAGPDERGGARVEVLYRVVGRGTALLAEAVAGQSVSIVGPLGRGFPIEPGDAPALLVGGGTGIASLYELAAGLAKVGRPVQVALGARGQADLIGRRDFEALAGVELVCTTEDGSVGRRGRVTEALIEGLERFGGAATVFACGPTPMMRAAAELARSHGADCWVSLENPMACGFGVCLGCAAPRREGGFSLVCRAGPVFAAGDIDWEGLP
jgi:dihydroorotate dehydrogenase electron transfer subunit